MRRAYVLRRRRWPAPRVFAPEWLQPEQAVQREASPPDAGPGWLRFDIDLGTDLLQVEVRVRRDTVDVRVSDHLAGIFDRQSLMNWLTRPIAEIVSDDVAFLSMRNQRVSIRIRRDASPAVLPPEVLAQLRRQIRSAA